MATTKAKKIARHWTLAEIDYLLENWGTTSVKTMAATLNRTPLAITERAYQEGLGPYTDNGEYVTLRELSRLVGVECVKGVRDNIMYKHGMPVHKKHRRKSSIYVVQIDEFWKWAETHQRYLDFRNLEYNILGAEPKWVESKRRRDYKYADARAAAEWSDDEDRRLSYMVRRGTYTIDDMARELGRSPTAIKARKHILCLSGWTKKTWKRWTKEDYAVMESALLAQDTFPRIARQLNRTTQAVKNMVHTRYGVCNVDDARAAILERKKHEHEEGK